MNSRPSRPRTVWLNSTNSPQTIDRCRIDAPVFTRGPQRVDDDRRIPEPVEEIVGVGIVGGEDRRGQHRSWPRRNALPEVGTLLDDPSSGNGAQHPAHGDARFSLYPVVERGHDTGEAKCGLLKPSLFIPSWISGMLMNSFQMRPLR